MLTKTCSRPHDLEVECSRSPRGAMSVDPNGSISLYGSLYGSRRAGPDSALSRETLDVLELGLAGFRPSSAPRPGQPVPAPASPSPHLVPLEDLSARPAQHLHGPRGLHSRCATCGQLRRAADHRSTHVQPWRLARQRHQRRGRFTRACAENRCMTAHEGAPRIKPATILHRLLRIRRFSDAQSPRRPPLRETPQPSRQNLQRHVRPGSKMFQVSPLPVSCVVLCIYKRRWKSLEISCSGHQCRAEHYRACKSDRTSSCQYIPPRSCAGPEVATASGTAGRHGSRSRGSRRERENPPRDSGEDVVHAEKNE